MSAFRVKLGANDLNCVDVLLNPIHSLTGHTECKDYADWIKQCMTMIYRETMSEEHRSCQGV